MRIPLRIDLLLLLLILVGCNSEQQKREREIARLEQAFGQSPSTDAAEALIEEYRQFARQFPTAHDLNSRYLYRAAELAFRLNRFSNAIELLNEAIRNHYPGANTPNNALLLGTLYEEKLGNPVLAQTVFLAVRESFPGFEPNKERITEENKNPTDHLVSIQQKIYSAGGGIDYRVANDFINSATVYAMLLPREESAAKWLFEAAETARNIRAFSKSLELYNWITERFRDSDEAPQALFLQAFTLDNDLSRYEEAGELYAAFLERYPDDEFAKDARFLLDNLGRDEEEIIRGFEEQNQ